MLELTKFESKFKLQPTISQGFLECDNYRKYRMHENKIAITVDISGHERVERSRCSVKLCENSSKLCKFPLQCLHNKETFYGIYKSWIDRSAIIVSGINQWPYYSISFMNSFIAALPRSNILDITNRPKNPDGFLACSEKKVLKFILINLVETFYFQV